MGVAATFMGKGVLDDDDPHWRGTVGLQSRDYELAGFEDADVVITVGYDLVEHAPINWNPKGDKRIVCIDTAPAEVDEHFITAIDLIGDIDLILRRLTALCGTGDPTTTTPSRARATSSAARFEAGATDDAFPMHPPRALWEIRQALGREDILDLRRRPAQAVDRAHVPGARAGHGASSPTASPGWASRCRRRSPRSSSSPSARSSRSTATAASS